jgi:two-component system, chemotaxis family, chemotaxis protein CheY
VRILIVEDDFASRRLLEKYLEEFGEIDSVSDGQEGLDAFKRIMNEGKKYDLICLDIMLPRMDGQVMLQELRRAEESHGIKGLNSVKVLMTTALGDAANIIQAFRSQCEGYLTKPFTKEQLLREIANMNLI